MHNLCIVMGIKKSAIHSFGGPNRAFEKAIASSSKYTHFRSQCNNTARQMRRTGAKTNLTPR